MINCWCFHPSCGVRVVAASSENFWWWSAAGAVVVDDGVPVARSIVTSHSMEEEMAPPPPRSVGRVLLRTKRKKEPPTQKVFTNLEKLDKCGRLRTPRAARELALWVLVPFTTPPPLGGFLCFFSQTLWNLVADKKEEDTFASVCAESVRASQFLILLKVSSSWHHQSFGKHGQGTD